MAEGLLPPNRRMERFYRVATVERGLIASVVAIAPRRRAACSRR